MCHHVFFFVLFFVFRLIFNRCKSFSPKINVLPWHLGDTWSCDWSSSGWDCQVMPVNYVLLCKKIYTFPVLKLYTKITLFNIASDGNLIRLDKANKDDKTRLNLSYWSLVIFPADTIRRRTNPSLPVSWHNYHINQVCFEFFTISGQWNAEHGKGFFSVKELQVRVTATHFPKISISMTLGKLRKSI